MLQTKEQDKTSEKDLKDTEIGNLPDKEFMNEHKDVHRAWGRGGWGLDEHNENVSNDKTG